MSVVSASDELRQVLAHYDVDAHDARISPLRSGLSFSGARLWHVQSARGDACLRRWPSEHPSRERLEFIQAVLWHVDQEGFHLVPVPWETREHHGYVRMGEHFWEVTPWLSGTADYRMRPNPRKLKAAMQALASFHRAAATFPLPDQQRAVSPTAVQRSARLEQLVAGELQAIAERVRATSLSRLRSRAQETIELFSRAHRLVAPHLLRAIALRVPVQPCIRDVWHPHVLFENDAVSGIVDFGAMRADSVACDVSRLLGSLVDDDPQGWQTGLAAYSALRPLGGEELDLAGALDRSSVLMSGLEWLRWIFVEQRQFDDMAAVELRLDEILVRLRFLADRG